MNFFQIVDQDKEILPAIGQVDAEIRKDPPPGLPRTHTYQTFAAGFAVAFVAVYALRKALK